MTCARIMNFRYYSSLCLYDEGREQKMIVDFSRRFITKILNSTAARGRETNHDFWNGFSLIFTSMVKLHVKVMFESNHQMNRRRIQHPIRSESSTRSTESYNFWFVSPTFDSFAFIYPGWIAREAEWFFWLFVIIIWCVCVSERWHRRRECLSTVFGTLVVFCWVFTTLAERHHGAERGCVDFLCVHACRCVLAPIGLWWMLGCEDFHSECVSACLYW